MPATPLLIPSTTNVPDKGQNLAWGRLIGASTALAAAEFAGTTRRPILMLAEDARHADQLEVEIRFFAGDAFDVLHFVEWETLPWDGFSPHQDIISQRLRVIATLPQMQTGIVIVSIPALLQRLPPIDYVAARTLVLRTGQTLNRREFIDDLTATGYLRIPQVGEHGEYAVRGSLIDVFPMGSSPDYLREVVRPAIDEGARTRGKTVQDVALLTDCFVVKGSTESERSRSEKEVRRQIALYASTPSYRGFLEFHGYPEIGKQLSALMREGRLQEMPALIGDELLATVAISQADGDLADQVRQRYAGAAPFVYSPPI